MAKKIQTSIIVIIVIAIVGILILASLNDEKNKFIGSWAVSETAYQYSFYNNNSLKLSIVIDNMGDLDDFINPNTSILNGNSYEIYNINWGTYSINDNTICIYWNSVNYSHLNPHKSGCYDYKFLENSRLSMSRVNETGGLEEIILYKV